MFSITAKNVNDAFHEAMWKMPIFGVEEQTRNGKVISVHGPVITKYLCPTERMLFHKGRDANPFFHIVEAMWMLAGRNDVHTVEFYAKNMANYSDNGHIIHGAYGYRWRQFFALDQIKWVIRHLMQQPNSRRAVISMWDPSEDTWAAWDGKDVPCNTTIYFRRINNTLDMTVCCRSNDIVWGCYGANAVHMSYLHEFVAQAIGIEVGCYYQISNNWHIYEPHFNLLKTQEELIDHYDAAKTMKLLEGINSDEFLMEVEGLFYDSPRTPTAPYLVKVVVPVMKSWEKYKQGRRLDAYNIACTIKDDAVAIACMNWLERRKK
jgi:thymidylate synthase